MEQLILRQAAIDAMAELQGRASSKGELTGISKAWKRIKQLPPIHPEPHWIPCSEGLPKEEGFYLVTLEDKCGAETTIRFFRIENGLRYWGKWGNETITAYMPLPEPYKGVTT